MSESEKFLRRWSRRKRNAAGLSEAPEASETTLPAAHATPPVPDHDAADRETDHKPFNLADLPPIESIDAKTDLSIFLQAGVPDELRLAALRRAWSADPSIRDYIGLVENGWDFNDPDGILGFGALPAGEDAARLLRRAIGAPASQQEKADDAQAAVGAADAAALAESCSSNQTLPSDEPGHAAAPMPPCGSDDLGHVAETDEPDIALQKEPEAGAGDQCARARRRHGSALPK